VVDLERDIHLAGIVGSLAVGCGRHGAPTVFAAKAGGQADPVADPIGIDDVVCISSAGKQMAAACAGMLVLDGIFDLDCPVREWIPELPGWASDIRLRHLVDHTAGWPDDAVRQLALRGIVSTWTNRAVLDLVCRQPGLVHQPGTVFSYSNIGYVCLAVAAERAAGEPMPVMAERRLFAPLGMNATCFWPGPAMHPPAVNAHPGWYPGLPNAQTVGDGGVWSRVRDLTRWNEAMISGALGVELTRLLHRPGRLDDGTPVDYAWGRFIHRSEHGNVYHHGGWWPGCATFLIHVPDTGHHAALVAFTNDAEPVNTLGRRLAGI
jgi:CubicO group peptidase (beta-lactamase class C family)